MAKGFEIRLNRTQIFALLFISCIPGSKYISLSEYQFSHESNESSNTYHIGLSDGLLGQLHKRNMVSESLEQ